MPGLLLLALTAGIFISARRLEAGETLTVLNTPAGVTPEALGYNLGHFMPESNAADWFRYSGVNAARVFINVSDIEPADDLVPVGDGVTTEVQFFARRARLRANAASAVEALDSTLVNWAAFTARYAGTSTGSNRQQLSYALGGLRDRGVAVLANITASPSRFPVAGEADWAGKWELWQHYYAQAFLLSRDCGVRRFSMFNEPNGWTGMTETDWLMRFRLCSDALQHGVADMNARYGKNLTPQIFGPNTANGAEKYNTAGPDAASTDTWGHDAVNGRHLMLDGTASPAWMNLHVYNYQKYTTRPYATGGLSGYINDVTALRGFISADMAGEPALPLALSEFNVRTGANYDTTTATQDSPADFAALGANCVALAENGVSQLYLFKFAQTASNSTCGIAKNGTHYVQNTAGSGWNYGGATKCAEVYRLFNKAARPGRVCYAHTATAGADPSVAAGLWSLPVMDPVTGDCFVFLASRETSAIPLSVDFSAWPVPRDAAVVIEEVSSRGSGGVVLLTELNQGKLPEMTMPAQSVRLLTIPSGAPETVISAAEADTRLSDGTAPGRTGGALPEMLVRSDGTVNGRHTGLMRIPLPPGNPARIKSALLTLNVSLSSAESIPPATPVQAHVYGVTSEGGGGAWTESAATWQSLPALLKQNVPAGAAIASNIVNGQGTAALMLGQLVVDSAVPVTRMLDVTDFVKTRPEGAAVSFLVVQPHRWDIAQPGLTAGDIQPAGILISSRESETGGGGEETLGTGGNNGPRLTLLRSESPWTVWKKASFSANWQVESTAGPTADPDRDGIANLLEYALHAPPLTPLTTILPALARVEAGGGGVGFHFTRDPRQDDLRRTVQLSSDPRGPWSEAAVSLRGEPFVSSTAGVSVTESASGSLQEVTLTLTPPPATGRRFLRLRVELLEP
ncbi:MAG: hypothetical protein V4726_12735 [Verrucomicrobiota bacterium]